AAFFDLDGTLLPAPSLEWRFASYLDQSGLLNLPGWIAHAVKNVLGDPLGTIFRNKSYLAGLPEMLAADWVRSHGRGLSHPASSPQAYATREGLPFFTPALRRLAWHASEGHCIFLISGTLAPLARVVAQDLSRRLNCAVPAGDGSAAQPIIEVCATELELRSGRWTGLLAGPHVTGEAKAQSIQQAAARDGIVLGESYAYGNSFADIAMLESAGHPMAVNPSLPLARLARSRGWEISRWTEGANAKSFLPANIPIAKGAQ
ncbi:MAG: HAD family hydrolase, partial [Candidatus Acidiferrales bacterium]